MSRFIGKIVGTILGFLIGGPTGALFGFIIGHLRDLRSRFISQTRSNPLQQDFFPDFSMSQEQKSVFAISIIVLGAKLAKADGHVTREEVLAFRQVFRSHNSQLGEIGDLFDKARRSSEGYEPYAARLAATFGGMPYILEEILAGLFYIAIADGPRLSSPEIIFLRRVAVLFGFSEEAFSRIAGRAGIRMTSSAPPPKRDAAYDVLGLPTTASKKEIKKTYHALIRKNHPDILVAKGIAPEKMNEATERMQRINAAYSSICKARNIK